ncbi:MAG TPA: gluconokinase [Terriglobia bacterium]|nr:gluconokinase [Terriglobia bacterium]
MAKGEASQACVVSVDVGTSSVRTLLFDGLGCEQPGFGVHLGYEVATTGDGGVEVDADKLVSLVVEGIDAVHERLKAEGLRPRAVACCTFWHNVLGLGADGHPTTPVLHPFDTRGAGAARKLAERIDSRRQHERTGCVLHASYLPAKLLWLSEARPDAFRATRRWMSFGEYLYLKLLGAAAPSTSMVSGSGLWNQRENQYDSELLRALPIEPGQLAAVDEMDQPATNLRDAYPSRWPLLDGIPWYPALGDGACNNIGSGCTTADRYALMVGTSGAMRSVSESAPVEIPQGLWCYRVDRKRYLLGGALSNGGGVYDWMKRNLALPSSDDEIEAKLASMPPGSHGLTMLPLFAGERSPGWRADARAAICGLGVHTSSIEILRAALESVALRFREIYDLMTASSGEPREVIASGGALLHSPAWIQMMPDGLGRRVVTCLEHETSARGAALLALERLGIISNVRDVPVRLGRAFDPVPDHQRIYEMQLQRQRALYAKLFGGEGAD